MLWRLVGLAHCADTPTEDKILIVDVTVYRKILFLHPAILY